MRPANAAGPAAPRGWPNRSAGGTWSAFALAQACVLPFTATIAYLVIFTNWAPWDDEGFMMMTVRHMLDGHRLYDAVSTAYGPVYYLYKWVLHGLLGLPLTHDVVRLSATGSWLATALLSSCVVFAMTRSVALGVVAQVLVLFHLRALTNEPGHPQEMGALCVAAIAALALAVRGGEQRLGLMALGVLVGLLAMIKVNLGVFAGAAVWMAISFTLRAGGGTAALRAVSVAAVVALPLLLVREGLGQGWGSFVGTEVAAILAVSMLARARAGEGEGGGAGALVTFAVACVAGVALGLLFPLLRGSSWSALVECLIVLPGKMAGAFGWRPRLAAFAPQVAALSVLLAALGAFWGSDRLRAGGGAAAVAVAKLVFAVCAVSASWIAEIPVLLSCVTPFLWVLLLPLPGAESRDTRWFARLVLVWLAVLQPLLLYPVPGSQRWFGTFLHAVCALVAFGDVAAWCRGLLADAARPVVRGVTAALMIAVVAQVTWGRFAVLRARHADLVSLGLPGAERIRIHPLHGELLRSLVEALRPSDTFLAYPGFNSLYFWTGKTPPTLDVLSHQMELVPEERQAAIVDALLRFPQAYVVRASGLRRPSKSFTRRIERYFEKGASVGKYEILFRRPDDAQR